MRLLLAVYLSAALHVAASAANTDGPIDIGTRRELFVDEHLIDRMAGGARRTLHHPVPQDFLHWSEPRWLEYPGAPEEQLYTNQIKPYLRAPHILIGLPTRYIERDWDASMEQLPQLTHRRTRSKASQRYGTALTEDLLMTSRDGRTFHRWSEAFLRPGPQRRASWAYGDHYIAWQLVATSAQMQGASDQLSLYATEGYWTGTSSRLRRYTLRLDGFVSVQAPLSGGKLVTKPVTFEGDELVLNFASSAAGSIRVGIVDRDGDPLEGLGTAQCIPIYGDSVERVVQWRSETGLSAHTGEPVRLRFILKDANLYAFRFR